MQHGETSSVNETHGTATASLSLSVAASLPLHENGVSAISRDDYYNCTLQISRNYNRAKLDQPFSHSGENSGGSAKRERERDVDDIF